MPAPTYPLQGADEVCSTEAYLKPSNEICNVLIAFLSFHGGIEKRGIRPVLSPSVEGGTQAGRGYENRGSVIHTCGHKDIEDRQGDMDR